MVKIFYGFKTNAYLGGVLFIDGLAEFQDDKEGIDFANRYYLKYEVIKADKPVKKVTKKRVKKDE
ncbi:hypothetical protein LAV60_15385 [Clostridium sporogenes]|uniref:hypothetical protein n=1 Tax=Clostridium sporogenes TaxID=1509 RepID=UPI002238CFD9|nr:hypothetical protein [Clostridium sporogenes]MCW6094553.1 hypothetical protein [Clostridium sporogenes]